jgi:processive 1,2-diacylglycerol beta-glucosyltransferase
MKILVIYATAGAGHRKAAEAVFNGLKSAAVHQVALVDSLDYTSPFYKKSYSAVYTFLISSVPWLWGFIFALIDVPALRPLVRLVRRLQNALNGGPLARFLKQEQFDYIISTHFFPNEVAAHIKRKGQIKSKIISVITDYDVHSIWLAAGIDIYTVATEWTKRRLLGLGIGTAQGAVTGIPTDAKFAQPQDRPALRRKLGLKEDVFTVLMATGSFGIGPMKEIVDALEGNPGIQVLVICGHNDHLYERLSREEKGLVKVYSLVDNMDELMAASDVMVTKPGGLSISEALVVGLPMIFFSAIPGQETGNIKVLKQSGVGISDCSVYEIARTLERLSKSKAELQTAKEKAKALGKPSAVKDIISLIK